MPALVTIPSSDIPQTNVLMGDFRSGKSPDSFRTVLGSCVGIALYDPRTRVGGLAHIVLPERTGTGPVGKFADTALPAMIQQLVELGGRPRSLLAKLAGGASMFDSSSVSDVGRANQAAVKRLLAERRIPVVAENLGGTRGRRMSFWLTTGRVVVESLGLDDHYEL